MPENIAVVEEGTIINSLLKDARILGSKSYKSLPNNYPAKDYPEITFVLDRYLGTPGQDGVLDQAEISELTVKDWTTITKTQTVPIRSRSAESENMCISLLLTETQEKLFRFLKTRLREKGETLALR